MDFGALLSNPGVAGLLNNPAIMQMAQVRA